MKKGLIILLSAAMLAAFAVGCGSDTPAGTGSEQQTESGVQTDSRAPQIE